MGRQKVTDAEICDALRRTQGMQMAAAKSLGISRKTIERRLANSEKVREAQVDARETLKDFAEAKLIEHIKEGNFVCLMFFLKTQARDRGYTEKVAMEHSGTIAHSLDGVAELTDAELEERIALVEGGAAKKTLSA